MHSNTEISRIAIFSRGPKGGRVYTKILLKNPLCRKILDFGGIKFTLPISQKRVYGHFRASFFCRGNTIFSTLEKRGFFSRIDN
jgi:hypothetical protein